MDKPGPVLVNAIHTRKRTPRGGISPRILLYSHDTFGLGNIRRTLLLAENFITQYPGAAILILTGSPMIHAFRIPAGVDYIKLPCVDRIDAEQYQPKFLPDCLTEFWQTRGAILKESVLGFDPDVMVVDKRPAGVNGELMEALLALRQQRRPTKLVLGMRDILDDAERTRDTLRKNGSFEILDRFFDEVWIYGSQAIFDAVKEYEFPKSVARKTRYCGYLKRPTVPAGPTNGTPHILVTTGGGGDGSFMIETYLKGLAGLPRSTALRTTVVTGPEMPNARRESLHARYGYLSDVTFLDFVPDMTRLYAEANVVVSMAGYNTVCEMLSFARPAILVPRAEPVREQLLRARLLAERGLFDLVEPEALQPELLINKVLHLLKSRPAARPAFPDMEGLPRIRERVSALLDEVRTCAIAR